jgi:tryptophanyl-tRNA synthetase
MPRILTALQPSGILHIGNYFGAIQPMVNMQSAENENLLFVVDYHAITVPQEPGVLQRNILFATATYLAAGIDPKRTILFQQSQVSEHTELAWILNCVARVSELGRMTQFKDKAKGKGEDVSVGLFDYPVLMAADILLYDTQVVPVGDDQKQHVELARDLAERFNKRFGETFVIPKPEIRKQGSRIMALDEPDKKMSKSATSAKNYISLMDDEKTVLKKIKAAVTDSEGTIKSDEARPGISNLIAIMSLVTNKTVKEIEHDYDGKGYGIFKTDLAKEITSFLSPMQTRINDYLTDKKSLVKILDEGSARAKTLANKKMELVRERIGTRL